jgi:hypothetical protein
MNANHIAEPSEDPTLLRVPDLHRSTQALILMGNWCGSSIRPRSTETPGLLDHLATEQHDHR